MSNPYVTPVLSSRHTFPSSFVFLVDQSQLPIFHPYVMGEQI